MLEKKDHVKRIQEITFEAYKSRAKARAGAVEHRRPCGV